MGVFPKLHPQLQSAIVHRLGWSSLRPVQDEAGEALLGGHNAVILAPTAGGKTEASLFPLLSSLLDDEPAGLGLLYIAPIKALLNNQARRLGTYTQMVGLDRFVWHGDVGSSARRSFLKEPSALLMTTPESLEVMLISTKVDAAKLFGDVRAVVIDEIHAMAGSDRGAHLMSVLERINQHSRHDLQRVGLSATVGNPDAILGWLQGSSAREGRVVNPPAPQARRHLLVTWREDQEAIARDAAKLAAGRKSLFFCESRATSEAVAQTMRRAGTEVFVHHSSVSKEEREDAERNFHEGSDACIVCTSTLELGIDVGDLDLVLQNQAPTTVSSFLQRMGRTGRRANTIANTTFLCETSDAVLQAIALIELARKGWVEHVRLSERCWPVLVHQLMAMALARAGVERDDAWAHLSRVPDFAGITRPEFNRVIQWMLRDGSLLLAGGRLALGPRAERRFGRRNFMEIYAVFESPQSYSVVMMATKRPVGSLSQAFVDRLVEGASSFVLGGRGWVVRSIDHSGRELLVDPAPRGRSPSWGGYLPQFLHFELCRSIREVLLDDAPCRFAHPSAAEVLAQAREGFARVLSEGGRNDIELADGELRWWTFAGGRINNTLKQALAALNADWKVLADNFSVKVRGEDRPEALVEAIAALEDPEFWEDEAFWQGVAAGLPSYRLSKFQPILPPWVEREMLAAHLLDIEGAWRFVAEPDHRVALQRLRLDAGEGTRRPEPIVPAVAGHQPSLPIEWVRTDEALAGACAALRRRAFVALDVETTIYDHRLCLVQLGTAEKSLLIDPFLIEDFGPLKALMEDPDVVKVIHNATFEKGVMAQHGVEIINVFDTLKESRRQRGRVEGGHSLLKVCERELDIVLSKEQQVSDWRQRPLSPAQERYAALDVEVLVALYPVFRSAGLF